MAVPMTYTSLTESIIANIQRNDEAFRKQVPDFIERAITKIYTEIDNLGIEKVKRENANPYQLTNGNPIIRKPTDWKKTLSLSYVNNDRGLTPLFPCSYEFAITYWPNAVLTGTPLFYTDYNGFDYQEANLQFYITPTPNINANLVHVYIGVPLFNENNQENAITRRYPDVLFYGSMLQAMTYVKDDNRIATFDKMYTSALGRTNVERKDSFVDRTVKREEG
jgi:hypothetical protein